jgi:hypothetical protein
MKYRFRPARVGDRAVQFDQLTNFDPIHCGRQLAGLSLRTNRTGGRFFHDLSIQ